MSWDLNFFLKVLYTLRRTLENENFLSYPTHDIYKTLREIISQSMLKNLDLCNILWLTIGKLFHKIYWKVWILCNILWLTIGKTHNIESFSLSHYLPVRQYSPKNTTVINKVQFYIEYWRLIRIIKTEDLVILLDKTYIHSTQVNLNNKRVNCPVEGVLLPMYINREW